jgi:hypothetical protein
VKSPWSITMVIRSTRTNRRSARHTIDNVDNNNNNNKTKVRLYVRFEFSIVVLSDSEWRCSPSLFFLQSRVLHRLR